MLTIVQPHTMNSLQGCIVGDAAKQLNNFSSVD